MKALASVQETHSSAFASFVDELNELSSRLGLRAHAHWSKSWEYPWINQRVSPYIRPGTRILDIGSELSPMPWNWAMRGAKVWMVESNSDCVAHWEACRDRLRAEGHLNEDDAIQWKIVNDERLPFENESFDLVSSFSVIEHMPDKNRAVSEAARVLRSDGILSVSFDICEPGMGMTFPEWNGCALTMAEFDRIIWNHPQLMPDDPDASWNVQDIPDFLAWHLTTAVHHNYVVGAAVLRKCCRWADARSILVTHLDSLGDIVLGTGMLAALHERWPSARITLVVRPDSTCVSSFLPEWIDVVALGFDPRDPIDGRETEIVAKLQETATKCRSQLCVIAEYNRVWAGEILASLCGAQSVVSFDGPGGLCADHCGIQEMLGENVDSRTWLQVHVEPRSHVISKYEKMCEVLTAGQPAPLPLRAADHANQGAAKLWEQLKLPGRGTVIFFPGTGDGLERSLDAETWAAWIRHVAHNAADAVLLLGSESDRATLDEISAFDLPKTARQSIISERESDLLAGMLGLADAFIGADAGPTHVAAALGLRTLAVVGGGHDARRFNPVGPRVAVIRMPIGCYGCEWLCPFEERLCIRRIPLEALCKASDELLQPASGSEMSFPPTIDIPAPASLDPDVLRALMHQHRAWLDLSHQWAEESARQVEENKLIKESVGHVYATLAAMTEQNTNRDQAIAQLSKAQAEMTRQQAELTCQNVRRDSRLAHLEESHRRTARIPEKLYRSIARLNPRSGSRRDDANETTGDVSTERNAEAK